jgi:integrase
MMQKLNGHSSSVAIPDCDSLMFLNFFGQTFIRIVFTSPNRKRVVESTALKLLGSPKSGNSKVFLLSSDWKTWGHLQTWSKKAGIDKHISFHVSRHTFAVLSLSNNVDIYTLSKLLGHTGVRNTEIYAKIIDQKKIEAVESIPSIEI